jgi:hypothetical protein
MIQNRGYRENTWLISNRTVGKGNVNKDLSKNRDLRAQDRNYEGLIQ